MAKRRPAKPFPASLPRRAQQPVSLEEAWYRGVVDSARDRMANVTIEDFDDFEPEPTTRIPGPVAPEYMRWLAEQPGGCDLWRSSPIECDGPIQIHHEPPKGMGGANRDDRKTNRLCMRHHDERTASRMDAAGRLLLRAKQVQHLTEYLDQLRAKGGE